MQGPAIERFRLLETIDKIALDVERSRPDLASIAAPNGTATILFTDIEGSTRLNELLGDDCWVSLLREHNETVRTQSALHSGFEVKSQVTGSCWPSRRLVCSGDPAVPRGAGPRDAGSPSEDRPAHRGTRSRGRRLLRGGRQPGLPHRRGSARFGDPRLIARARPRPELG